MTNLEAPNYRQIKVKYLAPTNHNGSRIKIYEPKRYNNDKTQGKIFSYCYKTGDVQEQAFNILKNNGFNIVCKASEFENYIFLCDNWADDFKQIKDLK